MNVIEKVFPQIVIDIAKIDLSEANDEIIMQADLSLEKSLNRIKETKELPTDYLEFINLLMEENDLKEIKDNRIHEILSSILRIYIFSRAQKKSKDIKNWLAKGNITVSGHSIRLSSLTNKMKSFVKINKTIKDLETRKKDFTGNEKIKNKADKLKELDFKIGEIKANKETLINGIKTTAITVETYLGAMIL